MANAFFNKANKAVSNLLFCRPIYHISPPISDDYFFKQQITVPTPILTISSCNFCLSRSWLTFGISFEDFSKVGVKWGKSKNCNFRPSRNAQLAEFKLVYYIYEYIRYGIQNFHSFRDTAVFIVA